MAAELDVVVREDFSCDRCPAVDFPAFTTAGSSEDSLRLSRYDAEGTISFIAGEPVRAVFEIAPREVALEGVLRVVSSFALLRHEGLVLHSSAIADAEGAHVFAGVSGAGKSTIASLLVQSWPVEQLSDELLILRRLSDGWSLIVSPFLGSKGLDHGRVEPLASVNLLVQAPENRRTKVSVHRAIQEICRHILTYAKDPESMGLILDLVTKLMREVPCYELQFVKDASVGDVMGLASRVRDA
ncbi:MAG: hypothetical protein GY811_26965 [Myxococcales bacterium]|nr:hypothetical protein [Myxococcales bacterium]